MKALVTGAKGFIGRNLCQSLLRLPDVEVLRNDVDSAPGELERQLDACDFVFHLAGVNRPREEGEFARGNAELAERILARLEARWRAGGTAAPVLLSSSIQAAQDNPYGRSKLAAERAAFRYGKRTGAPVHVFRLANVFGKWCRPNYNSVIATWCHNLSRDLPITVRDPNAPIRLVYVDDVVAAFVGRLGVSAADASSARARRLSVKPCYRKTLGEVSELIRSFAAEPSTREVPDQGDDFSRKLYATYLSHLPEDSFAYPLVTHADARGSFSEFLRTPDRGQVSVNVARPGAVKGGHWHHTKHEKFLVVKGEGLVRLRRVDGGSETVEYRVSGERLDVVRIPPGWAHSIANVGADDLVTVMWANEPFNPARPDTYGEKV